MTFNFNKSQFPCPVCTEPREVRITKKKKPYIVCDACGIQMFIRGSAGIEAFTKLVERAGKDDLWTRLSKMEQTYHLKCSKCGGRFWAAPEQIQTSLFDGSFKGFACPKCGTTVEWERRG
jgi:predicted RNA-binding Zn-ribbon protein involved in translation (DUF1610 family)